MAEPYFLPQVARATQFPAGDALGEEEIFLGRFRSEDSMVGNTTLVLRFVSKDGQRQLYEWFRLQVSIF